ncbi:S8 family peptidase [Pseudarthrobacter oxydans]|uniref:S8 family peptidase n=1 Tax=Pseudarthrobacter oxydans TaxID=1671 RepID=UPI003823F0FA
MNDRPLLAFGPPAVGPIPSQRQSGRPKVIGPSPESQERKFGPQFLELKRTLEAQRVQLASQTDETDPELVVVFDLAGTVDDFRKATARVEGLEFLDEFLGEPTPPDDDFHMEDRDGPTRGKVQESLYVVLSNSKAVDELVRLFGDWRRDPNVTLATGLNPFKRVFAQLRALRRWNAEDRIRETGLLEQWQEELEIVGQFNSSKLVEVELWYRQNPEDRTVAERETRQVLAAAQAEVISTTIIPSIAYHALLVRLPVQQVEKVLAEGAANIGLLNLESVMFVSPFVAMSWPPAAASGTAAPDFLPRAKPSGLPRIALLDGLPLSNHALLQDRLTIDDPDGFDDLYPASSRHHGTAMASLILHGDLSDPEPPLQRPLYVRPILKPDDFFQNHEKTPENVLFTDLLHQSIRRIFEGTGDQPAAAPSVRIVNLSIGEESRAFVRRMSPAARLLDWLAHTYNVLIVVSAGNHRDARITLAPEEFTDVDSARRAALRSAHTGSRTRGLLSPSEGINVLTVGALHSDAADDPAMSDLVLDLGSPDLPSLYGAVGPGFRRSVKPEIFLPGGRALYSRQSASNTDVALASTPATGPGQLTAAPSRSGMAFSHGTSNAAALATKAADAIFDFLENPDVRPEPFPFPDAQFHPILAKALLIHSSGWGAGKAQLMDALGLSSSSARKEITKLLGYGALDRDRLGRASASRAVLIGAGLIQEGQRATYSIPKPTDLRATTDWRRLTITLSWFSPTMPKSHKYRGARLFFTGPGDSEIGATQTEAEHWSTRSGTSQHQVFEGTSALAFADQEQFEIHVDCRDDAGRHASAVRYALVASIEVAPTTSTRLYDQVQQGLRTQIRARQNARFRI